MTPFVYSFFCALAAAGYAVTILIVAYQRSRRDVIATAVLLHADRPAAIEAAPNDLVAKVSRSPEALGEFLDSYLGAATAAKRDAWERANSDTAYLKQLGADYLKQLDDIALCPRWLQWAGKSRTEWQGVDPKERLKRISAIKRWFDSRQAVIAICGLAVLILMLFFPPWIRRKDDLTRFMLHTEEYTVLSEQFLGYRFILNPGWPPDEAEGIHSGDLFKYRSIRTRSLVSAPYLFGQLVALSVVAGIVVYRGKRPVR